MKNVNLITANTLSAAVVITDIAVVVVAADKLIAIERCNAANPVNLTNLNGGESTYQQYVKQRG